MNLELKIPPPIIALVCAALMWILGRSFTGLDFNFLNRKLVSALLLLVGLSIDIFALFKFRQKQTTINPMKPDMSTELVITGIYKHSRNPMYLGLVFILCSWVMFLGNAASIILLPAFVLYITKFQISPEEKIMQEKFSESFSEYKQKVRRWI